MIHVNYQPLSWENEWKIFKFNLKQLWAKRNKRILENRINRETYKICFFLHVGIIVSLLPFFVMLFRLGWMNTNTAITGVLIGTCVSLLFLLYAAGKRCQDLGIPAITVLIVVFLCMWYTSFFSNPIFFSYDDPFELVKKPGGGYVTILRLPDFVVWLTIFLGLILIFPQGKRNNRYGKVPGAGITFFEKNFPEWQGNANYIWQTKTEEEKYKLSFTHFFIAISRLVKDIFNFKGRMSWTDFRSFGGLLILCQGIIAFDIFTPNVNDSILFLIKAHVILFIPTLSAYVRRLHDGYNSALWIPLTYIPLINIFVYLMLLVTPSWKAEDIKLEE